MKPIIILIFSLFFCELLNAQEIKHKRIECAKKGNERYLNVFIIIKSDEKSAVIYTAKKFEIYKEWYDVNYDIDNIRFIHLTLNNSIFNYNIKRADGRLENFFKDNFKCEPMEIGFSPEPYLKNQIKINLENKHKENKF